MLEIKEAAKNQVRQNDAPEIGYKKPPPQSKGIASQVAEDTGLSVRTIQRALNPKPPVPIKSVVEPESEEEAIVAAWLVG
ncbi:hypothetical protein [Sphingosinicella sp.]|uniref:hypothetical protein n=1 Tax=Sphingosinicella sp. TaxID=1917971 RepID=UPI00260AA5A4|nr:hypothetical protein [Sphingosinicella sp.]